MSTSFTLRQLARSQCAVQGQTKLNLMHSILEVLEQQRYLIVWFGGKKLNKSKLHGKRSFECVLEEVSPVGTCN